DRAELEHQGAARGGEHGRPRTVDRGDPPGHLRRRERHDVAVPPVEALARGQNTRTELPDLPEQLRVPHRLEALEEQLTSPVDHLDVRGTERERPSVA